MTGALLIMLFGIGVVLLNIVRELELIRADRRLRMLVRAGLIHPSEGN